MNCVQRSFVSSHHGTNKIIFLNISLVSFITEFDVVALMEFIHDIVFEHIPEGGGGGKSTPIDFAP